MGVVVDSGARCAVLARALDEPLAGTAPVAPRWLCVEHRGAWPSDILVHPDPAVQAFVTRATSSGWRVVLIRRPGRRPDDDGSTRLYFAATDPASSQVTTLTVAGPAGLAGVDLAGGQPGENVTDPLLLICTHGRRDRCCALDGRALALAVIAAGEADVWECTHLGGHRFAPTALVLPTGYLYGRLDVATAISARKRAALGEVETACCRGRSTWSPEGQVAELAVRVATGLRDADALTVQAVSGAEVHVIAKSGRRWAVEVHPDHGTPRPPSCGAALAAPTPLRATRVRRLRH